MDNWKWNKKRRTKSSLWNFIESWNIKITYKVAVYLRLSKEEYNNEEVTVMKKWNPEKVNVILKNENYTGTLLQGKRRKLY